MTQVLYPPQPGLYTRLCSKCRQWKPTNDGRRWHYRQCYDCVSAYSAAYHAAHREEKQAYYITHREELLAYATTYREERQDYRATYRSTHREEQRAYNATYRQTEVGKEARRRHDRNRRARKNNAICQHGPSCFAAAAVQMLPRCAVPSCKAKKDIVADHIIPLAHGGQDCRHNLQPLCRHHNAVKRDRLQDAHRTGYLL